MKHFIFTIIVLLSACKSLTPFEKDTKAFWTKHQYELYTDDRAPLKKEDLKKLNYYKPNPAYKVEAVFSKFNDGTPFEMATYAGTTKTYTKYGSLIFKLEGKEYELALYQSEKLKQMEEYRNHLFLPFKDVTSGEETYGGGRYIDLETTDFKNGRVVLDFNKAYNPWCAYSDGYSCPIPPKENHLSTRIEAGEKMPDLKH